MRTTHNRQLTVSEAQETERQGLLPERPELTKRQIEFLEIYSVSPFLPLKEICRQTGVTPAQVGKWKKNSDGFRIALDKEYRRSQMVSNMSRKRVMHGMLEAVEMAKDMRQPNTMVSGWKEIGRMCGFYEPERREISLSVNGQQILQELKSIPKEKLLELAAEQDAVEAQYEVISADELGNTD